MIIKVPGDLYLSGSGEYSANHGLIALSQALNSWSLRSCPASVDSLMIVRKASPRLLRSLHAPQWQLVGSLTNGKSSFPPEVASLLSRILTLPAGALQQNSIPPTMLERARSIAADYENLSKQISTNYDSKVAKKVGELSPTAEALKDWERVSNVRLS